MKNKSTKVALVTGSSQGIGEGIARVLASNGYSVVITYKTNADLAKKVVDDITSQGGTVTAVQLDVTSESSVKACFEFVEKKYGVLNVLVNNAAVDAISPVETCTLERWHEITHTKIDGNFLCTKYALPLLKKPGKADLIVIMSSMGDKPDPEDVAYSIATAATMCFVKAMALGLAKYGIRTNGVGPGETRTNNGYWVEAGLTKDEDWEKFAKDNLLGRTTTPEDVGQTVLSIVENPTEFWNGNFIYVNGGGHLK